MLEWVSGNHTKTARWTVSIGYVVVFIFLLFPATTKPQESSSAITFEQQAYTYFLAIKNVPKCPGILDTLYSMDTMRELTSFVDDIEMLRDDGDFQIVQVNFSMLNHNGTLVYDRAVDRAVSRLTIKLRAFKNDFRQIPYPKAFTAIYVVHHEQGQTTINYGQRALMSKPLSGFHRWFVEKQMSRFRKKLNKIVSRNCK